MLNHNYIAIEGNIGSGKTSLVRMLASQYGVRAMYEQFEENPFLPLFYEDKYRYAFQVELAFLADRYHQMQKEHSSINLFEPELISDYIFSKCLVFAGVTLAEQELKLYRNLFDIIHNQLVKPDLIVYLYVESDRLLQNISKRGRMYERSITAEYLESIHQAYFSHFKQLQDQAILVVDTSAIDFVANNKHYIQLLAAINQTYPKGTTRIEL